jgi:hypothetical protein
MNINRFKDARVCDHRELLCRVQISYTELGKVLRITSGMTATAGVDGMLGINEDRLVCFELTLFGGKPLNEVFRLPISEVKNIEIHQGFLGLSQIMMVETTKRRYKLVASPNKRPMLDAIRDEFQKLQSQE